MKYGFIGCGNMGGVLATAAAKAVGGANILLADTDPQKAGALAQKIGAAVADANQIAGECDYIILGVKPQGMEKLLQSITLQGSPVLISMAAGLKIETLSAMLGKKASWIRIMPNTPVAVGEGRILYTTKDISAEQKETFLNLFAKAGKLYELPEHLIDAGTALSGCGPAFVYLFIEALADGAVTCGIPRETALELAAGTVLGAAKNAIESGKHPAELKDAVCSPGGSTIEGVAALERNAFRGAVMEAVEKSFERTKELGGTKK